MSAPVGGVRGRAHGLVALLLAFGCLVSITSAARTADRTVASVAGETAAPPPTTTGDGPGPDLGAAPVGDQVDGSGQAGGPTERAGPDHGVGGDGEVALDDSLPPVRVVYLLTDDAGLGALTGAQNPGEGNEADRQARDFQALVEHANRTGGIGGRRIEAEGLVLSVTDIISEDALVQRCIEATEDRGADFVIDTVAMRYLSAQSCFAQHATVLVTAAASATDAELRSLAPYVATTWPTVDRQLAAALPRLQDVGYLDGARLGVFLDDRPGLVAAYEATLLPALQAAGVEPVATARSAQGDSARQANAVLQFRSAGVDRVLFVGNTLHFLGFSNAAQSQGYRPRYAFLDYGDGVGAFARFGSASQLEGAVAVSACDYFTVCIAESASRSGTDVTSALDPASVTPGLRGCIELLSEVRGVDYFDVRSSGQSGALPYVCDHFLLWLRAARAVGREVTPANWSTGLRSLGAGAYTSSFIHATDFSDGRQSGATHFAAGSYDAFCLCYVRRTAWAPS